MRVSPSRLARPTRWTVVLVLAVTVSCGEADDADESTTESTVTPSIVATATPSTAHGSTGSLALSVDAGCATVVSSDGAEWANSCLPPSMSRPRAVVSDTTDAGDERALIRVFPGATLASASDPSIRFDQDDGWVLIESPTADFTMTFQVEAPADSTGVMEVVCDYNPFFIDCDTTT